MQMHVHGYMVDLLSCGIIIVVNVVTRVNFSVSLYIGCICYLFCLIKDVQAF